MSSHHSPPARLVMSTSVTVAFAILLWTLKTEIFLLEVKNMVPNNCESLNRNTWELALPTSSKRGKILYLDSEFFVQSLLWPKLLCHQNHGIGHGWGGFSASGLAAPCETVSSDLTKQTLNSGKRSETAEMCVCAQSDSPFLLARLCGYSSAATQNRL